MGDHARYNRARPCTQAKRAMAFSMKVSVKTVETHRAALMDRLRIHGVPGSFGVTSGFSRCPRCMPPAIIGT